MPVLGRHRQRPAGRGYHVHVWCDRQQLANHIVRVRDLLEVVQDQQ
jgi:hypothetical protein